MRAPLTAPTPPPRPRPTRSSGTTQPRPPPAEFPEVTLEAEPPQERDAVLDLLERGRDGRLPPQAHDHRLPGLAARRVAVPLDHVVVDQPPAPLRLDPH